MTEIGAQQGEAMSEKLLKDIKFKSFPAMIVTFGLAIISAIAGFFLLRAPSRVANPPVALETATNLREFSQTVNEKQPTIAPSPTAKPSATAQTNAASPKADEKAIAHQGILRVSNPTDHPVRVALLLKKPAALEANQHGYENPAHWDFDPGEGGTKGLIISLPNRRIKLKKGDVLVAFAQDGSRRYWGPYVIGETTEPNWLAKETEWQLTLDP
jgi:hypothetical protein